MGGDGRGYRITLLSPATSLGRRSGAAFLCAENGDRAICRRSLVCRMERESACRHALCCSVGLVTRSKSGGSMQNACDAVDCLRPGTGLRKRCESALRRRGYYDIEDIVQSAVVRLLRWPPHAAMNCPEAAAWLAVRQEAALLTRTWSRQQSQRVPVCSPQVARNLGPLRVMVAEVLDEVSRLAEAQRSVLLLAALGAKPREIADALGITQGDARKRLWRGRHHLRGRIPIDVATLADVWPEPGSC